MSRGTYAWVRRALGVALLVLACGVTSAQAAAGVEDLGWGKAVPISTQAPSWFTPTLYRRVVAAGPRGIPLSSLHLRSGHGGSNPKAKGSASTACLYSNGSGPT